MQHVIIEKRADNGAVIGCYHDLEAVTSARPGIVFDQGEPDTSGRAELVIYRARTVHENFLYEVHEVRRANKCAECWAPTPYPLCDQCQNDYALANSMGATAMRRDPIIMDADGARELVARYFEDCRAARRVREAWSAEMHLRRTRAEYARAWKAWKLANEIRRRVAAMTGNRNGPAKAWADECRVILARAERAHRRALNQQ